ncbi:far upstream element-binding protein 1 isoform X3 [Ricinus communis]|uniref:far upstream element-binding protein 1 isoform X3 n=1 Tax=Ricinus communis TaxID=3988 RepID=UPI00201B047C|nr:far upstream element-binding protein 1 isoform X3 [Ricinus communis]
MAEEEVVVAAATANATNTNTSPVASDHNKRKLQDLEPEEAQAPAEANPSDDANKKSDDVAEGDTQEAKRLRTVDENKSDGLASENGIGKDKPEGGQEKSDKDEQEEEDVNAQETVGKGEEPANADDNDTVDNDTKEAASVGDSKKDADDNDTVDNDIKEAASVGDSKKDDATEKQQEADEETARPPEEESEPESDDAQTTSRKMEVPNDKVGVLIGKGGDTIRYLQYNSGAKIQITRDMDADPHSTTRPVELIGTLSSISKAEKLINAVIAEADAGGSPSLVARGLPSAQTAGVGDQIEMQVPNEKVGLIIGRGGDTIKALQAKSGARIQLIPQHPPEGDASKERTVRVTGDRKQIEIAREMIKDVMSQQNVRLSPLSGGYNQQQSYRPRGPTGPSHWGPRGPHSSQPSPYDYHHRGPYPSQNSQYPPPSYGGYPPQHMGPRGNFGSGWEQRPPNMQGPVSHGGGYDYYGGQGGHVPDHPSSAPISNPITGHATGPSPTPGMGHPPSQANYNYGQQHGPDYGHQAPYSQAVSQHGYGHGYDEPKYDSHAQTQHPYGHGNPQPVYPQASNQPGYGAQQQYGKQPSYGMLPQGPPQSYGPPRPGQPGDMPYQAPNPSSQSYGSNVPPQQQYPYASSGPMQQAYPSYGAPSATDGYNQGLPASVPGYPQQAGQSVASYGQPGGQQASAYVQGPSGGYGSYPSSQQAYPEQPAQNSAGYGYQGSQDPAYATGPGSAYAAPASGQQGYAQPTPTQPSYDQSVPQSTAYAAAAPPASAPVSYGKTVSPQPGYPQYDSTQMYAAPR